MKKIRRFLAGFLSFCLVLPLGLGVPVFASTEDTADDYYEIREDGTRVVGAFRVINGEVFPLSKEEYLASGDLQIEGSENFLADGPNQSSRVVGTPVSFYKEKGHISYFEKSELRRRISSYLENHSSAPAQLSFACSYTQGIEVTGSMTPSDQNVIEMALSVSVNHTASAQQTITAQVNPKKKAWIELIPAFYNTYGDMQYGVSTDIYPYYTITSTKYVSVFFPLKKAGYLDGKYLICEQDIL